MPQFSKSKPSSTRTFIHAKGWLRDKIIIHRQEGPGGIHPVFVSLNGFSCQIPREVECEVTKPIVQVLREAIPTLTFTDEKGEKYERDVQRYNMSVLEENVNWEDIMASPEFEPQNREFLKALGKYDDAKRRAPRIIAADLMPAEDPEEDDE